MQFSLLLLDKEADRQFILVSLVADVLVGVASVQAVLAHVGRTQVLGEVGSGGVAGSGSVVRRDSEALLVLDA